MYASTSYDKVCARMLQTEEWSLVRGEVGRRIKTTRLMDTKFLFRDDGTSHVKFFYGYPGTSGLSEVWDSARSEVHRFRLDLSEYVSKSELVNLAKSLWDSGKVPTYNCKWEKEKGARNKDSIQGHFPIYARQALSLDLAEDIRTVESYVVEKIMEFYDVGFMERRREAFEQSAVHEIKKTLMKYRTLDTEILKRAVSEFICEDVLSC